MDSSPALLPAAGLCLGIWFAEEVQPEPLTAGLLCAVSIVLLYGSLLAGRHLSSPAYGFAVISAFFGFGFLRLTLALPQHYPLHYAHQNAENERIDVRLLELLSPTETAIRWKATAVSISGKPVTGDLLLQIPDSLDIKSWLPADRISIFGTLTRPARNLNPYAFNYAPYLKNQGVYCIIYVKPGMYRHQPEKYPSPWERIRRLRITLIKALENSGLEPAETQLAQSLLLGYRALDTDRYKHFQDAGAAHVLAVSGLHVGILSTLIGWLLWPLRRLTFGRVIHGVLVVALLWSYVLLAGAGPAIVRAAVLFTLLTYAVLQGKAGQSVHFWAMAILILLGIIEPRWLFQAGFQLSFAAVWSILVFYPKVYRLWPYKKGLWAYFGQLNCLGISAQIGVLPLSLYYFHQFPLHFLISNLVLVPALGLVLGWGYIILIFSFFDHIPTLILGGYRLVLGTIYDITEALGTMDAFIITRISWGSVALMLSLFAILFFSGWLRIGRFNGSTLGFCCLVLLEGYLVRETATASQTVSWIVPHRIGESCVWLRSGLNLTVYSNRPEAVATLVEQYATGKGVQSVRYLPLGNFYTIGSSRLLRIDSSGCYPKTNYTADVLLLSESPRIHLGLAITRLNPILVIADGSNYRSDLIRWEKTCQKYGVPFHVTAQKGAYQQEVSQIP
ncbi:ComEC family competence protein [Robiginitalea sp.]|nr:ComEC family competence protein [Robiginitalea sp.]